MNFLVDTIFVVCITALIVLLLNKQHSDVAKSICYALSLIGYYLILEATTGRTIGKLMTGTMVVNLSGERPNFRNIFLRTILRLNPFDWISYAFGAGTGTHDLLSRTRVVKAANNG